jgi:hypothetical protein
MKTLLAILIVVTVIGFWFIHHDRITAERRAEIQSANSANFKAYQDCLTAADQEPGNHPHDYQGTENHKAAVDACYAVFESYQEKINK